MKKEEVYNEAIGGDEGFAPGEGYPSCDGQPCANVSGDDGVATDTMTDATPTGDEGPSDGAASGEAGEESGVEAGGSEQLAPELERRIAEWQDKYLRLQAEFDNYRKRTLREKMELVERGGADVIKAMLPVADDMDRAVEAMAGSDDIEALRAGVGLIAQKFHEVLRSCGVSEGLNWTPITTRRWRDFRPAKSSAARLSTWCRKAIGCVTRCFVSRRSS